MASVAAHHDDLGHELANGFYQIALRGHHVVDVLIGSRNLVDSARQQSHILLLQMIVANEATFTSRR